MGPATTRVKIPRVEIYIPIVWRGENAITEVTKKVAGFRKRWLFIDAKAAREELEQNSPGYTWPRVVS